MNKLILILFSLIILCGCAPAPVPVDDNSFSFGARNYRQAYSCTVKAINAAGFTVASPRKANPIIGSLVPRDAMDGNRFEGVFTLDEKARTVNASIKKHLGSDWSLVFDNKSEIDDLLNKFQASYESCFVK